MLWGEFQSEVTSRIHNSALTSNVWQWFNSVQMEVLALTEWQHFKTRTPLPTTAPYSTGTVAVVTGSPTITVTGGVIPAAAVGQLFRLTREGPYYAITAVAAGGLTATLEIGYPGASGSGLAYTIVFYALTPPIDISDGEINALVLLDGSSDGEPLVAVEEGHLMSVRPNEAKPTGRPRFFRFESGKILLNPAPDGVYTLALHAQRSPAMKTASSDPAGSLDWRLDMQYAILDGVLAIGYDFEDDSLADKHRARFETKIARVVGKQNRKLGTIGRMRRFDEPDPRLRGPRLPESI